MRDVDVRSVLEAERRRLGEVQRVLREEHLEREPETDSLGELSPMDQHQADLGSEVFEREKLLSLMGRVSADLVEVDEAVRRLERGEYGRCQTCREPISEARLEAMPATRFCAEHQTFWEAARMTVAPPGGPMPGEDGMPIEEVVERMALANLDLLPGDDELGDGIAVGPEESAIHEAPGGGRRRGAVMTDASIELAEAREGEDAEHWRDEAEAREAEQVRDTEVVVREEAQLATDAENHGRAAR